jgi:hypothetical protein
VPVANYNYYNKVVLCGIVFFQYVYKILKFDWGYIGLHSFLLTEISVLGDKDVTLLIIIGGPRLVLDANDREQCTK